MEVRAYIDKLHYLIRLDTGNTLRRHANQIRKIGQQTPRQNEHTSRDKTYNNENKNGL